MKTINKLESNAIAADGVDQGTDSAGGKEKTKSRRSKNQGPCHVYTITLNGTDKTYVGITSRPIKSRWADHKRLSLQEKTKQHIHAAIRKYGPESFDWAHVCTCESRADAILAEETWIAAGWGHYNKTKGGEGVVGHHRTEEQRRAISERKKGKPAWNKGLKNV